jgi:hypothetical protein
MSAPTLLPERVVSSSSFVPLAFDAVKRIETILEAERAADGMSGRAARDTADLRRSAVLAEWSRRIQTARP